MSSSTTKNQASSSANPSQLLSTPQIQLLEAIADTGSISAAAKKIGVSYKTAWDRIDSMNNLSEKALVSRSIGGVKGGGTIVTEYGKRLIAGYTVFAEEQKKILEVAVDPLQPFDEIKNFIKNNKINSSARNQYRGRIQAIQLGAVNAEIDISITPSLSIVAQVTLDSAQRMQLQADTEVTALIKSSWIILSKDTQLQTSARNKLVGTVERINKGSVNTEVILGLEDGKTICAMITDTSSESLELKPDDQACAIFKASSVLLIMD